ncbi:hypothetical protein [Planctomycetes bacterium TBK1r]|uniref:Uncharacterized protein n=1 Tax=Stieleria magnilauensis TaxID=2527963 RepID=A0ABX5XWY9_9BACT|nr:hypothetical protein TBK1r_50900 [Planctomycetes bacterium TBK1r]
MKSSVTRRYLLAFAILFGLLLSTRVAYAWATERIGPDSQHPHATVASPDWPTNLIRLFRHPSRVYSRWVNGSEAVYFNANPPETMELIEAFSETQLRDHEVWILPAADEHIVSFEKQEIRYNVRLAKPGRLKKLIDRLDGKDLATYEPVLYVCLDATGAEAVANFGFPDHLIVHNQFADLQLPATATKPKRTAWHGRMIGDEWKTVATANRNVASELMLWTTNEEAGIRLGSASRDGWFESLFSDQEIADLKSGKSWITVAVGDRQRKPRSDDSRVPIDKLVPGRMPVEGIARINK